MNVLQKIISVGVFALLAMYSCTEQTGSIEQVDRFPEHYNTWADTIVYEVLITNPDSLNEWESTKLKDVNAKRVVDDIFTMIYNGEKKAYNYYSNESLSIKDIEDIEARDDFSRDKVGKLQFTEIWKMDIANHKMDKKVLSILLAYELYNDSNKLRGYKAAFYLKDF